MELAQALAALAAALKNDPAVNDQTRAAVETLAATAAKEIERQQWNADTAA